jgi:hypothetical protein
MGGMRGGKLTLPKLLQLIIVLNKRKEELISLNRQLSFYNTKMRIASTRRQAKLTQQFINTNKMTPDKATREVIELPSVEAKLHKVMELLNRSSKDLAINPPSSLSPSASAQSPASASAAPASAATGNGTDYTEISSHEPSENLSVGQQLRQAVWRAFPGTRKHYSAGGKRKSKKSKTRKTRKTRKSKTHKKSKKSKKSKTHKKRVTRKKK